MSILLLPGSEADTAWMDDLRRNIARRLSIGADQHRAAGRDETADRLDAAALRFDPALKN